PCLKKGKQKIRNKLQFLEDLYGNIQKLAEQGHSEKAVIKALDPKNDRVIKWFTTGNASFANMVRSALASIHNR
ncbi:MAG: MBL fold metallo-hydrolase, partial [Desulfobacterales bacterium]